MKLTKKQFDRRLLKKEMQEVKVNKCVICNKVIPLNKQLCSEHMDAYFTQTSKEYIPRALFIKKTLIERLKEGLPCPSN